jgi:pimeloyl-ACP methyl ester carboxylesterase
MSARAIWRAVLSATALVCTFAFGMSSAWAGAESSGAGGLLLHPCTVSGYSARCGTLMVPVDRLTGTGPKIPIRVAVVPASGPVHDADPTVWFQGGPGGSAVDYAGQQMPLFALDQSRDVVFIDQRGTGASNVTCPAFPSLRAKAALRASVKSCLQHLKTDLRFYTTAMFTDDVAEVLSDLRYSKVNVVGGSYGATSAQVFLLRHPDRVRTMTLLSGTLLDVPFFELVPQNAQRALDNVFAECASGASCHAAFPHLGADWGSLWASVTKAPWVVPARLSPTHQQVVFDSDQLASSVHQLLMDATTQTALPLAVHTVAAAKDKVAAIAAIAKAIPPAESTTSGNQMMGYAIRCNEPWARYDPGQVVGKDSFEYSLEVEDAQWWQYVCALMPKAGPAAGSEQLTRSLVPVLALNGQEDPQDPPANMAGARSFWPNSLELAVPDQGHQVDPELSGSCVISIVDSFIEHGSVAHLDTSCLSQVPSPAFAFTLQGLTDS